MLFETERLEVKEAAESDIERIIRLESQPDVRDYLWIGTTEEHKEELRTQITFFVFLKTRRLPNMKDTPS